MCSKGKINCDIIGDEAIEQLVCAFNGVIKINRPDIVAYFLERGINPDWLEPASGRKPLENAILVDSYPLVALLLNAGAILASEPETRIKWKNFAKEKGKPNAVRAFIESGKGVHAAGLLATVILYTDGYLQKNTVQFSLSKSISAPSAMRDNDQKAASSSSDIHRFFKIASELPLELQMLLCNRTYGILNTFINNFLITNTLEKCVLGYSRPS